MSETALAKSDGKEVSFVPFGSQTPIRLSAAMVQQFVAVRTRSGALPGERDCVKFVLLCQARRLNPFEGDAFLIGYDGKDGPQFSLITAHQAFLKRAELSPEYNGMESGVSIITEAGEFVERPGDFFFGKEKLVGAWARVHFKTRAAPMFKRIKREVYDTQRSRWAIDPAGMLVKCAEADALRSSFPTMLGGLYTEGEMMKVAADVMPDRAPVTMPVELSIPEVTTMPKEQPSTPPPTEKQEPPQAPTGPTATGIVDIVTAKSGKKQNGKPWTRYGVKMNGQFYNTFSDSIAETANASKELNQNVVICYEINDKGYKDIVSMAFVSDPSGEQPVEDREPIQEGVFE